MTRTIVGFKGDYTDNFDSIIDWGEEIDLRVYDPNNWVKENLIPIC